MPDSVSRGHDLAIVKLFADENEFLECLVLLVYSLGIKKKLGCMKKLG